MRAGLGVWCTRSNHHTSIPRCSTSPSPWRDANTPSSRLLVLKSPQPLLAEVIKLFMSAEVWCAGREAPRLLCKAGSELSGSAGQVESLSWASLRASLTSDDALAPCAPLHVVFMLVSLLGLCHGDNLFHMHQEGQPPLFSSPLLSIQAWDGL